MNYLSSRKKCVISIVFANSMTKRLVTVLPILAKCSISILPGNGTFRGYRKGTLDLTGLMILPISLMNDQGNQDVKKEQLYFVPE